MSRSKTTNNLPLTLSGDKTAERAIRYGLGALLFLIAGAGLLFAIHLINKYFYRHNPHFVLVNIDTEPTANYSSDRIVTMLSEEGIEIGRNNLMQLKLRDVREIYSREPLIRAVEVRRILPDTLRIRFQERVPVALLHCRPAFSMDDYGVILPYDLKELPDTMPHITGVRNPSKLIPGQKTDDRMLAAALRLLQLTRTRPDGQYLDIALIQLDYHREQLRLIVRALPYSPLFRSGAQIMVPVTGMNSALDRLQEIITHKIKNHGTISEVDVTYSNRVKVLP